MGGGRGLVNPVVALVKSGIHCGGSAVYHLMFAKGNYGARVWGQTKMTHTRGTPTQILRFDSATWRKCLEDRKVRFTEPVSCAKGEHLVLKTSMASRTANDGSMPDKVLASNLGFDSGEGA